MVVIYFFVCYEKVDFVGWKETLVIDGWCECYDFYSEIEKVKSINVCFVDVALNETVTFNRKIIDVYWKSMLAIRQLSIQYSLDEILYYRHFYIGF